MKLQILRGLPYTKSAQEKLSDLLNYIQETKFKSWINFRRGTFKLKTFHTTWEDFQRNSKIMACTYDIDDLHKR